MLRGLPSPIARTLSFPLCFCYRKGYRPKCTSIEMGHENLHSQGRRQASFRLCNVSSYTTELLEIRAKDPTIHVLFIPGNPGVVTFYKDFVESLYDLLRGSASVTAIGHISHTKKNWEHGRLFSLQEQIEHKIDFIKHELQIIEIPIILVGHSIGSYISIEIFRKYPKKVIYCIGLYPFLALNMESLVQSIIRKIAASSILCAVLSSVAVLLGLLPSWASRFIVTKSLGRSWSATAVEAACTHLPQYHTMRNILFMGMTEFKKAASTGCQDFQEMILTSQPTRLREDSLYSLYLRYHIKQSHLPSFKELSETPDWAFMRGKQGQNAFLFGVDDHWGPLSMYEEISKQVPDVALSIEREGHMHAFCCSEAGSLWVAQHVVSLIKNQTSSSSQEGSFEKAELIRQ